MPKRWIIDSCYAVVFYLLNFTHHGHFNVTWVHTSRISFVACRKVSLFHLFACNKLKEIAEICMQAWRMSLTKPVCQTLSLMLIIDGLTLLIYTIDTLVPMLWNLGPVSVLADKLRIVFETSKLKIGDNFVFEKFIHTENYLLLTGHWICHLLNEKNNSYNKWLVRKSHVFIF